MSPWEQAIHGDRAAAYFLRHHQGQLELSLEMPTEGVRRVQVEAAEKFEMGFARAKRTDALRAAGQLNPQSPWGQIFHGDRA